MTYSPSSPPTKASFCAGLDKLFQINRNAVMPFRLLAVVLLNFLSFSPILALYVVQGSNCTSVCSQRIIPSTTSGSDITCYDRDYNTTAVGALFKDCVACEVQSQTFDHVTEQTDLGWALCKYCR